jgi:hypothetical protein
MRKMLLSVVVLLGAACANKTNAPAPGQAVATEAAPQAVIQAAPAATAEPPKGEQKPDEAMRPVAKPRKARRTVNVARTTQQKPAQPKLPVTENMRKDGPG